MALWIVGLGLTEDQLTRRAMELMGSGARIMLRTGRCGAADYLAHMGIAYETLDDAYDQCEDFDDLADDLARRVAEAGDPVVYGVLDLRDESVGRLLSLRPDARLAPGVPLEGPLAGRALGPCQAFAASDMDRVEPEAGIGALVREISSRTLASEVKLRLMRRYPSEHPTLFWPGEGPVQTVPLSELDRQSAYDHRSCTYLPAQADLSRLERFGMREFTRICQTLRGPKGCPWDRAQTHLSLKPYVVEEAWEVADAIDRGDADALCEELGDLLLQVGLHADIARQYGEFDIDDVTGGICQKMMARHPHVFAGRAGEDIGVLWEAAKRREKGLTSDEDAIRAVACGLPALMRAQKVLGKAEKAGKGLSLESGAPFTDEAALGNALLQIVERARRSALNAEIALKGAVDAFIRDISGPNPM